MGREYVSLGDGDEACKTRFGGEQIVTTRIEAVVGNAIADRKEFARRIEEKAKFHFLEEIFRELDESRKAADQRFTGCGRTCKTLYDRIDFVKGIALSGAVFRQAFAQRREVAYGALAVVRRIGQRRDREKRARHRRRNQILFGDRSALSGSLVKHKPCPGNCRGEIACMTFDGRAHSLSPGEQLAIGAVTALGYQCSRNVRHGVSPAPELIKAHKPIGWSLGNRTESDGQSNDGFIQVFP